MKKKASETRTKRKRNHEGREERLGIHYRYDSKNMTEAGSVPSGLKPGQGRAGAPAFRLGFVMDILKLET